MGCPGLGNGGLGCSGLRTWWTEDAVDWNAIDWKEDQDALDLGFAGSGYAGCCRPYALGWDH